MQLIFTTFPNEEDAKRIVRILVDEKLIACGNIYPQSTSIYRWKNAVTMESEWAAILKTTEERLEELSTRLKELHSFEVPEMIAVPVSGASTEYAEWVAESCKR
ncbi:MAG: divalent-cation tolerance protein CutA [Chthoniobacterales bacterium]